MQTASFLLTFNSAGSHIPMRGVTPPEFAVLRFKHQANAGKHVVEQGSFTITGEKRIVRKEAVPAVIEKDEKTGEEVEMQAAQPAVYVPFPTGLEMQRLRARYGKKEVNALYPGENPNLPTTFSEVGLNDDGSASASAAGSARIDDGTGKIIEIPLPATNTRMAPASDGVPAVRGEETPSHLAIAVGE